MQRRTRARLLFVLGVTIAVVLLWRPGAAHVRAASLLARFEDPKATSAIAGAAHHPVQHSLLSVPLEGSDPAPARLYVPVGVRGAPGIVVLHGVHRLGIEEPRLVRFAETIAAT